MFSKMLVATDLSEASNKVVCALGGLKPLGTREALLIDCFNIRDVGTLADHLMELARPSFEWQKKVLGELGFETSGRMVLGLPHIEINRIAEEEKCSLIVIGSHGRTMAGEIALGGVASAIIHSATRPVLIVRLRLTHEHDQTVCHEPSCNPLEHVLFPTDFSDNAENAFSYVEKIAECRARRVTLLHVQDQSKIDPHLKDRLKEFNRIDTQRLNRFKEQLEAKGVEDIRIEMPYGSPKKEIIERTRQGDVSWVVMGSQGRGFLAELFLGSVSHAVARHSEVPVLLIPAIR